MIKFDFDLNEKRVVGTDYGYIIEYPELDYKLHYRLANEEMFMEDLLSFCWWDKDLHNDPSFKQTKGKKARYGYYQMKLTELTEMNFNALNAKGLLD